MLPRRRRSWRSSVVASRSISTALRPPLRHRARPDSAPPSSYCQQQSWQHCTLYCTPCGFRMSVATTPCQKLPCAPYIIMCKCATCSCIWPPLGGRRPRQGRHACHRAADRPREIAARCHVAIEERQSAVSRRKAVARLDRGRYASRRSRVSPAIPFDTYRHSASRIVHRTRIGTIAFLATIRTTVRCAFAIRRRAHQWVKKQHTV